MKKSIILSVALLALMACGNSESQAEGTNNSKIENAESGSLVKSEGISMGNVHFEIAGKKFGNSNAVVNPEQNFFKVEVTEFGKATIRLQDENSDAYVLLTMQDDGIKRGCAWGDYINLGTGRNDIPMQCTITAVDDKGLIYEAVSGHILINNCKDDFVGGMFEGRTDSDVFLMGAFELSF